MLLWDNVNYFEDLIAEYAGSKYAVAVDSCTNAIFLSLQLSGKPSVVSVPKRTYISVPMQVAHCGYKIKFKDAQWTGCYRLDPLPIIDSAQRFTENMYIPDTLYCLSFHSKKILSIGRGGMILTDDRDARDWLKRSRYDGRESVYYNDIKQQHTMTLGWHMYMTPEQAVRGVEQFYNTPKINEDGPGSDGFAVDLSALPCFKEHVL
jgi:dTDP-4-amino-4,6-dideoxygalactose transaminase